MSAILLHLWGPFSIHSYGFFIALGLVIFMYLVMQDGRFKRLSLEHSFFDIIMVGIIFSLVGGRVLFVISEQEELESIVDFFAFWQGGLSILGAVMGALVGVSFFLRLKKIPILPFLDLVAVYAPLLQAVSRIGCFCAGCCYGMSCSYHWAVIYTDNQCYAPLNVYIHPTQLYSAGILFALFLFLFFYLKNKKLPRGFLLASYIFCMALERFLVDFWRADRCRVVTYFSYNQYVAFFLMALAMIGAIISFYFQKKKNVFTSI